MLQEIQPDPEPKLSDEEHKKELSYWERAFTNAENARRPLEERWESYYQLKRSYVEGRETDDWHSKVFIPLVFFTIQTVLPRLVAQLPRPIVKPVAPDDIAGAKMMEDRLVWAMEQSELLLRLVEVFDDALTYGTGILKVRPVKNLRHRRTLSPKMTDMTIEVPTPIFDPTSGAPMTDIDGEPMIENQVQNLGTYPEMDDAGNPVMEEIDEEVISYVGPMAEVVDPFNFYVAPEASSIHDARYVIQRRYIEREEFLRLVKEKSYSRPENVGMADFFSIEDDPQQRRPDIIDMGSGPGQDDTRRQVEIWECWRRGDEMRFVVANRKAIVASGPWPFRHGMLPYVRVIDHLNAHEFWGTGEVEHLEGIQDSVNALWNQRIDNVRLLLNAMFMLDEDAVTSKTDLRMRPGGVISVTNPNGMPLQNVIQRIDLGDVTTSAYTEVTELIGMSEKISGASGYATGAEPMDSTNQTATGAAILSEQGNARFAMKNTLAELVGFNDLMRQYGELLQEFTPPDMQMRVTDAETGAEAFQRVGEAALNAALDYFIEAASHTQTETVRQNQAMSLFQSLFQATDATTGLPLVNQQTLVDDLLEAFDKRSLARYRPPQHVQMMQQQMLMQQMMAMQQSQLPPGEEGAPTEEAPAEEQPAF